MKEIPVFGGLVALVDDEDYELVRWYAWHKHPGAGRTIYARTNLRGVKPGRSILMHRLIMGNPEGTQVDHKNGDGLNCQRSNLRLATAAQNNHNVAKQRTSRGKVPTSQFKGVSRVKRCPRKPWVAQVQIDGRQMHLGNFASEQEAARVYDGFSLKHFGEFARLNAC